MKIAFLFILLGFSFSVFADENCQQVVEGYEDTDKMYVICNDLLQKTIIEINQTIETVMNQYQGEPDEITVYFVSSKSAVGKSYGMLTANELVGFYYTHDGLLTYWPKINSRKKEVFLAL